MKHVFFGQNLIVKYAPQYWVSSYGGPYKDYRVIKSESLFSWGEFYSKKEIPIALEKDQSIVINDKTYYIRDVKFDVSKNQYNYYTNKVLSETVEGRTFDEVQKEIDDKIESENKPGGWFKSLFSLGE